MQDYQYYGITLKNQSEEKRTGCLSRWVWQCGVMGSLQSSFTATDGAEEDGRHSVRVGGISAPSPSRETIGVNRREWSLWLQKKIIYNA
jgi:hypothetical protein